MIQTTLFKYQFVIFPKIQQYKLSSVEKNSLNIHLSTMCKLQAEFLCFVTRTDFDFDEHIRSLVSIRSTDKHIRLICVSIFLSHLIANYSPMLIGESFNC